MNTHSDIGSKLSNILFWDVDKNDIVYPINYRLFIQSMKSFLVNPNERRLFLIINSGIGSMCV